MNDYKDYQKRQHGLKEAQFIPASLLEKGGHPGIDPEDWMRAGKKEKREHPQLSQSDADLIAKQHLRKGVKEEAPMSPTARPTPIIAVGIRGSVTGGLPSGADQQGDISPTKVGGYDRVDPQNLNSKLVDKTPENPEIHQDTTPINDNPSTGQGVTHPHQIQVTAHEEPQAATGASTDSDPTLKLKSAVPKGIDIDITEQGADEESSSTMERDNKNTTMIPTTSLSEGKHKAGCKCGFCANKGSFGKKKEVEEEHGDDDYGKDADSEEKHDKQWRKDRSASKAGDDVRKSWEKDDKKSELDETFKRHMMLMKEYLNEAKCDCCKGDPCTCPPDCSCKHKPGYESTKKKYFDPKTKQTRDVDWIKKTNECATCGCGDPTKVHDEEEEEGKKELNESYSAPFSRMRGLAGVGEMILTSNGLWENVGANEPFTNKFEMDKKKAGFVKIDEEKLNKVKATLERKSKRGSLSDKELQLAKKLDEVLKRRQAGA